MRKEEREKQPFVRTESGPAELWPSAAHSLDSILVTAGAVLTSASTSYVAEWTRRRTAEFCSDSHTPIPDTTMLVIERFESPPITKECCETITKKKKKSNAIRKRIT